MCKDEHRIIRKNLETRGWRPKWPTPEEVIRYELKIASLKAKRPSHVQPTQLLTRKEAAEYIGVNEAVLSMWSSSESYGLQRIKVGRVFKYRVSDIEEFIDRHLTRRILSTCE